MTREEAKEFIAQSVKSDVDIALVADAIKALEQEPFINKSCVSGGVCKHDKQKVLDKIRAEIEQITSRYSISRERGGMGRVEWSDNLIKESEVLKILDKYKADIKPQECEET